MGADLSILHILRLSILFMRLHNPRSVSCRPLTFGTLLPLLQKAWDLQMEPRYSQQRRPSIARLEVRMLSVDSFIDTGLDANTPNNSLALPLSPSPAVLICLPPSHHCLVFIFSLSPSFLSSYLLLLTLPLSPLSSLSSSFIHSHSPPSVVLRQPGSQPLHSSFIPRAARTSARERVLFDN